MITNIYFAHLTSVRFEHCVSWVTSNQFYYIYYILFCRTKKYTNLVNQSWFSFSCSICLRNFYNDITRSGEHLNNCDYASEIWEFDGNMERQNTHVRKSSLEQQYKNVCENNCLNPDLGGLFRGSFWGGWGCVKLPFPNKIC